MILSRVGIPLLRFHLHPSQCRSIGQTIGLTAYPPQRAAIFTMPLLARTFPAYSRLRALFEASDTSTTSEPTVPSGIVSFGPSRSGVCQTFKLQGLAYPTTRSRELTLAQLWSLTSPSLEPPRQPSNQRAYSRAGWLPSQLGRAAQCNVFPQTWPRL